MKAVRIGKQKFYSVKTLSEMLSIPVGTVRKYIRKNRIKAVKVGKRWLVSEKNLEIFLSGEGDK